MKSKILVSSILTIVLCFSLIVGSTFALFTSEDKFDISITSGKVNIDAAASIVGVYSAKGEATGTLVDENGATYVHDPRTDDDGDGVYVFANGGTAAISGADLVIDRLTPGDKVVLNVNVDNKSNVAIQYRYKLVVAEGDLLASGMVTTVDSVATTGVKSYVSAWFTAEANQPIGAKQLAVELPIAAGNMYQDLTVKYNVVVEAVQGNGVTKNEAEVVVYDLPENAADLAGDLTSDAEDVHVILDKNMDLPIGSLGQQTGGSGEYKLGGADTKEITIDLNGQTLNIETTYWSSLGAVNPDATITIKNGTMTSSQTSGTWNSYDLTFANCNWVFENVTFDKAIAFTNTGKSVTIKDVTINETHDYYALWIQAEGQIVNIDGLTINSNGRGIKIDEQYSGANVAKVTLNVANATFNTVSKAAIMVKSAAGADITLDNVDITGVVADTVNTVWVDADANAYAGLVNVTGGNKIVEP